MFRKALSTGPCIGALALVLSCAATGAGAQTIPLQTPPVEPPVYDLPPVTVGPAQAAAPAPPAPWQTRDRARLEACLALTETSPELALEEGLSWRAQDGRIDAEHCVAAALVARGDLEAGAARLQSLAAASDAGDGEARALLLSKAANAWLLAGDGEAALAATDRALDLSPGTYELVEDRAAALILLRRWSDALVPLDQLIESGQGSALLHRWRAEARMQLGQFDAADADVATAISLAPAETDNYVVRGRAREARRLGRAPQ